MIKDLRAPYTHTVDDKLNQWLRAQLATLTTEVSGRHHGLVEEPAGSAVGASPAPGDPLITPLLAEASQRSFFRITHRKRRLILMASPPALERNDAFVALCQVFGAASIPVPTIYACDLELGYFLMQDLGVQALRDHYETEQEAAAVAAAINLLPRLQAIQSPHIPAYTRQRLSDELNIFSDWFLGRLLDTEPPAALLDCYQDLVDAAATQPQVCVHRDYHCRNLLWNDGALGIVDFQDALHGPYTYDLASLLHDCYYQWPSAALERYREQGRALIAPTIEPTVFQQQLEWMAMQRQLKAIGIFVRLKLRDGRTSHLDHVLPTLAQCIHLTRRYAELEAVGGWLETLLPQAEKRLAQLAGS